MKNQERTCKVESFDKELSPTAVAALPLLVLKLHLESGDRKIVKSHSALAESILSGSWGCDQSQSPQFPNYKVFSKSVGR